MKVLLMLLLALPVRAEINPLTEIRYCGPAARDVDGRIIRSTRVLSAFRKIYACPATKLKTGACPGWSMDHIIPLACNGCDAVWNLQWLPVQIKSAAGEFPKDRWERKVYCL